MFCQEHLVGRKALGERNVIFMSFSTHKLFRWNKTQDLQNSCALLVQNPEQTQTNKAVKAIRDGRDAYFKVRNVEIYGPEKYTTLQRI